MSGEYGFSIKENLTFARIDEETKFLLVDSAVHNFIHRGLVFDADDSEVDVDIVGPALWHIKTGAKELQSLYIFSTFNGAAVIRIYEDPTFGTDPSDGVEIPFQNKKRNSSNVLLSKFYRDPVLGGGGALGDPFIIRPIPGGTGAGASQRIGGESGSRSEWELKEDTSYIFEVTPAVNGIDVFMEVLDTYEAPE